MGDAVWYVLPWIIGLGGCAGVWLFIKMDQLKNPDEYEVIIDE